MANWCAQKHVPAVFVLAGGYTDWITMDELVDLHLHTVTAFASRYSRLAARPVVTASR